MANTWFGSPLKPGGSSNSQRKPTGRHVLFYAVDLLELDGEEARPTYC